MFTFRYRKEPSYSPFTERINGFIDVVAWTAPHLTVTAGFIVLLSAGIVTFWNKSGRLVKASLGSSVALFVAL